MTDASKTLLPYHRTSGVSSRCSIVESVAEHGVCLYDMGSISNKWRPVIDGTFYGGAVYETREEAENVLDEILQRQGYRLLTE